jgi:hypothetical protein
MDLLQSRSKVPPFYSHFLAWRLGVWKNEDRFQYLDTLLEHAMTLPNWTNERCTSYAPDYEQFFSLVWELQMAKFLSLQPNFKVSWMRTGPDIQVYVDQDVFYIECYSYRKSFGIELFINEILSRVHSAIKVKHARNLIFSLPKQGKELSDFLEQVLSPFLDEQYLLNLLKSAEAKWPAIVPIPEAANNFYIYVDGDEPKVFDIHTSVPYSTGDPELYLKVSIREAVDNKRKSNSIAEHRPNLLAINFLMSPDYQLAIDRSRFYGQELPLADFGTQFDGFLFAVCGINTCVSTI